MTTKPIRLDYKYPKLAQEDLPENPNFFPISFKNDEIENFPVLFVHRLMKNSYGDPSTVEIDLSPKELDKAIESGKLKLEDKFPDEWKYYIRTPSFGIIQVGTERKHTSLKLHHVLPETTKSPDKKTIKAGKEFVNDLLSEANRLKGNLLNPKTDVIAQGKDVKSYILNNVYLHNYGSAEFMLEYGEDIEIRLRTECLKYDAVNHDLGSKEMAHITKFSLGCGMCYATAISYYFMAIEGFVNLVYHAFMKDELRDRRLEKQLSLELKLLLLPSLCLGFKNEHIDGKSNIIKDFRKFRDYRNQTFHSKIEDSLKSVCVFESGFFYSYNKDINTRDFLPLNKGKLKKEHVLKAKNIVDGLTKEVLAKMDGPIRKLTTKYILNESHVMFDKDKKGRIRMKGSV